MKREGSVGSTARAEAGLRAVMVGDHVYIHPPLFVPHYNEQVFGPAFLLAVSYTRLAGFADALDRRRNAHMSEIVARFHYRHEAEYARGFLEEAGIPSALQVDDAGGAQMGMAFANPARIVVNDEDAEGAREVLRDAGLLEAD